MADIQSATAEIRRGKKEERKKERRKNKPQHENIMVCRCRYYSKGQWRWIAGVSSLNGYLVHQGGHWTTFLG